MSGSSQPDFAERRVRCPGCEGLSLYSPRNPYRPFCSARCKGIDLGAWAEESFRLPEDTPPDEPFGDPGCSDSSCAVGVSLA